MRPAIVFVCLVFAAPAFAAEQSAPGFKTVPADRLIAHVEILGRTPSDLAVERVDLHSLPVAIEPFEGELKKLPAGLPKAIEALRAKLAAAGFATNDAPLVLFVAVSDERFSGELLLPLANLPEKPVEGLRFGASPGGKALRITHKGPLESLEDTYFELQTFVEDGEFEMADRMIERYLTDPTKTEPKDMVTEIYLALN